MKRKAAVILSTAMMCSLLSNVTVPASDRADGEAGIFGDTYLEVKPFARGALAKTAIGSTGFWAETTGTDYNNVVIMDNATKATSGGYYPYGSGLPDRGFYLFMGVGGSGGETVYLTLPEPAEPGQYLEITYAKPYATNNGTTNRSAGNANVMKIGDEITDIQGICEYDTWYTTTVQLEEAVSQISLDFGKWSAIAISDLAVRQQADMMELIAPEAKKCYITSKEQTLQYQAKVYRSVTASADDSALIVKRGTEAKANVTYSVSGADGESIDPDGILTVSPEAKEGTVTVSAVCNGITKTAQLVLERLSDADEVKIVGDELVKKGETVTLDALPFVDGTLVPVRATTWSIEGDAHGCSIENGTLTVPEDAVSGNITVKAELTVDGEQTVAGVLDTYNITIYDETSHAPYEVKGIFTKNCIAKVSDAGGIAGAAVRKTAQENGYRLVVKALDKNGLTLAQKTVSLDAAGMGVTETAVGLEVSGAARARAYVVNDRDEIVSEQLYETEETSYKNVPLAADWITGEKSGLGMGAGIMAPSGAPYGVNPTLVDVAELNVGYTYDENYQLPLSDNVLWYKEGAYVQPLGTNNNSIYARDGVDWEQEALPIGNGYMGAMLFGLPDKDQIQINEETFWAAGYRGVQSEVKEDTVNKQMSEGINGFMSVGNIFVDFHMPRGASVNNYYRDLNLGEAVAHVRYTYDGKDYKREYFASYPREVLVFRYTGENLHFDVTPVSMHPGSVTVESGEITITGKLKDSEPYNSGGNAAWNQESDLEYCTKIKVIADDGTVTDGYNTVGVNGASGVTILVAAATDYDKDQFTLKADGSVDFSKTPYKNPRGAAAAIEKAAARIDGAKGMTYAALKAEHIADYKEQFDKVSFRLTDENEVCDTPTDELQRTFQQVVKLERGTTDISYDKASYEALNRHLEELHFHYARYLMISSSRAQTLPATLQGKWCQSTAEIWGSCYCININMEMNYWFAGGANLMDSGKSLIFWLKSQIPAGTVTARNMYKVTPKSYRFADGKMTFADSAAEADDVFIMHTKQAIMGTTDLTGSTSIQSAGNTAWLMYNLWDLYQTSGDKQLLRDDIYPIMRKAANFYTQYLYTNLRKETTDTKRYPDGYFYTTWKGRSPEHGPSQEGIKYDLQLVAGMYDDTIAAAEILGMDADKVTAWKEIRNHLEIPVELGTDGQVKEWAQETAYNMDASGAALGESVHRHISHLVGLYPGNLINRETPELLEGAKVVLENRGDDATGWSCSNKFLLWARVLNGDKALELFRYQLAQKTYANLFDTHAPFQIDGNFGSAAGVMELLMQSQTGTIYLLPALPAVWPQGAISGIKAKNGAQVSIEWNDGSAQQFTIIPAVSGDIKLGYTAGATFRMDNKKYMKFDEQGLYTLKNAEAGAVYTFARAIDGSADSETDGPENSESETTESQSPEESETTESTESEKPESSESEATESAESQTPGESEATESTESEKPDSSESEVTESEKPDSSESETMESQSPGESEATESEKPESSENGMPSTETTTPQNSESNGVSGGTQKPTPLKKGASFAAAKHTYRVTKSGATPTVAFTGTKSRAQKIKIPDTVRDKNGVAYRVTSVAKKALKGNKKVKTLTVGKHVKTIGDFAFADCAKLTKVTINSTSLTQIGKSAFSGDKNWELSR